MKNQRACLVLNWNTQVKRRTNRSAANGSARKESSYNLRTIIDSDSPISVNSPGFVAVDNIIDRVKAFSFQFFHNGAGRSKVFKDFLGDFGPLRSGYGRLFHFLPLIHFKYGASGKTVSVSYVSQLYCIFKPNVNLSIPLLTFFSYSLSLLLFFPIRKIPYASFLEVFRNKK